MISAGKHRTDDSCLSIVCDGADDGEVAGAGEVGSDTVGDREEVRFVAVHDVAEDAADGIEVSDPADLWSVRVPGTRRLASYRTGLADPLVRDGEAEPAAVRAP